MSDNARAKSLGLKLTTRASFELLAFFFTLRVLGFGSMRRRVANCTVADRRVDDGLLAPLTQVVDRVCAYSLWETRCLARAAIATRLLRGLGFDATMVTGVQRMPFCAHAWVELDGKAVYGLPDPKVVYHEIDRC